MSTTNYDYWGESSGGLITGWNYYTDEALQNFAFTIDTYRNYTNTPGSNVRSLFTISAGSVTPGTNYYRMTSYARYD